MKIYEIGTGYTPIPAKMGAATEIVVEELTRAMLRQGADVEIIDIQAEERLPNQLPITEVKVPRCFAGTDVQLGIMHKLKRVVYSICLARKLAGILKKEEKKVVLHFHNQYNMFFYLKMVPHKLRQKALTAYTNHSGVWSLPWDECKEVVRKRYFQEEECMKKADIVFALNQKTISNVVEYCGVAAEKFIRINNGVNTEIYHVLTDAEKEETKEAYGLAGKKIILQVGSVCENKGQNKVIQWLAPVLKRTPDLVYAYAGGIVSEEYHQQMKTTAREENVEDQVVYLGMVQPGQKLNQVYNAAEATVCASGFEGFSLAIVESLAAGTPVLIQEGSSFHVGNGCVLYTGKTIGALIGEMMAMPEKHMSTRDEARQNACDHYSWDKIAQEYRGHFGKAEK